MAIEEGAKVAINFDWSSDSASGIVRMGPARSAHAELPRTALDLGATIVDSKSLPLDRDFGTCGLFLGVPWFRQR